MPDELYGEVTRAWTYRNLTREDFDRCVDYRGDRRLCAQGL